MEELAIRSLAGSKAGIFCVMAVSVLGLFLNLGLFIKTVLDRFTRRSATVRCTLYITHMLVAVTGCLIVYLSLANGRGAQWMCLVGNFMGSLGYQASVGCLFLGAVLACVCKGSKRKREERDQAQAQELIQSPKSHTLTMELVGLALVWLCSVLSAFISVVPIFHNPLQNQTRTCQALSAMSEHGASWAYTFGLYVCTDGLLLSAAVVLSIVARCRCAHGVSWESMGIPLGCWTLWLPCVYFGESHLMI